VNDFSTDSTWESVKRFVKGKSFYRLLQHDRNCGQATARNTWAKAATGKALFFCDDDDLYFPEHITTALRLMNQPLKQNQSRFMLPFNFPSAVRTGVHMSDPIHPHWKQQIERVSCLNLCVRKEAHNFVEGFPEDPVFPSSEHGNEDTNYSNWLANFCAIVFTPMETVEYIRYPGNHYDRQLEHLKKPPSEVRNEATPEEQEKLKEIDQIYRQRLQYLEQKLKRLSLETPEQIFIRGNELFNSGDLDSALECYRQCITIEPEFTQAKLNFAITLRDLDRLDEAFFLFEEVVKAATNHADAWNSLGTISGRRRECEKAISYYETALQHKPDKAITHLNLAMELLRSNRPVGKQKQSRDGASLFLSIFKQNPNRSSINQLQST
jgi:tetratricopeptide (TPR) repeat protein